MNRTPPAGIAMIRPVYQAVGPPAVFAGPILAANQLVI